MRAGGIIIFIIGLFPLVIGIIGYWIEIGYWVEMDERFGGLRFPVNLILLGIVSIVGGVMMVGTAVKVKKQAGGISIFLCGLVLLIIGKIGILPYPMEMLRSFLGNPDNLAHGIEITLIILGIAGMIGGWTMFGIAARARWIYKVCPDCAERVRKVSKVCKHCGYKFEEVEEAEEKKKKKE